MKFYIITSSIVIVLVLSLFLGYIAYYNHISQQEESQYQQQINEVQVKQARLNEQSQQATSIHSQEIIQTEETRNQQDSDNDGLTYAQELALGTSDNNKDSDADTIDDNEDAHPAGGGNVFKKTVYWQHNGQSYTTQFGIPEDLYLYYKNYDRSNYHYQDGRFATPNDPIIQTIARDITDVSISTGETCKYCLAIDFVESMVYDYVELNTNTEYPRYAVETMVDETGDCEDTSFLMASILKSLGIDTVLLLYSDHMAVGVSCNGCSGTYYNYNGKQYYFLETTSMPNIWTLGQIWGKYGEESPRVIE